MPAAAAAAAPPARRRKPAQPPPAAAAAAARRHRPAAAARPLGGDDDPQATNPPFAFAAATIAIAALFAYLAASAPPPPPRDAVHAVVIDAGSTGTRAQLFTFAAGDRDRDRAPLVLLSTEMHEMPGRVAALAFGGGGGGKAFLAPLVDKLRAAVPVAARRARVPIVLRATAGLRLLGDDAAEAALRECRAALRASGFLFSDAAASVLAEVDEAVHAWTGVNYLAAAAAARAPGRRDDAEPRRLVGVLDLGGSSMQVAFASGADVAEPPRLSEAQVRAGQPQPRAPSVVAARSPAGGTTRVVAKSHLGHGLFDFSKRLYALFDREGVLVNGNPCFRRGAAFPRKSLLFGVPGHEEARVVDIRGDGDFDRCVASVEIVLDGFDVPAAGAAALAQAGAVEFYAFAYFYERVVGFGLPEAPTRLDLRRKGVQLCNAPLPQGYRAASGAEVADAACAEFSYVYALLKRLSNDFDEKTGVTFRFVQRIDGHVLGWALGSVLEELSDDVVDRQLRRPGGK